MEPIDFMIANQIPDRRQVDFGRDDLVQIGNLADRCN